MNLPEIPAHSAPQPQLLLTPGTNKAAEELCDTYAIHYSLRAGCDGRVELSVAAAVISAGQDYHCYSCGAALVIAIGDACCAYHNYRIDMSAKGPLQTASDSVALVVSALAAN